MPDKFGFFEPDRNEKGEMPKIARQLSALGAGSWQLLITQPQTKQLNYDE